MAAISADAPRTTPLASARRSWRILALFLQLGLLSFALLLFMMLPSAEVNEGRDRPDEARNIACVTEDPTGSPLADPTGTVFGCP